MNQSKGNNVQSCIEVYCVSSALSLPVWAAVVRRLGSFTVRFSLQTVLSRQSRRSTGVTDNISGGSVVISSAGEKPAAISPGHWNT